VVFFTYLTKREKLDAIKEIVKEKIRAMTRNSEQQQMIQQTVVTKERTPVKGMER